MLPVCELMEKALSAGAYSKVVRVLTNPICLESSFQEFSKPIIIQFGEISLLRIPMIAQTADLTLTRFSSIFLSPIVPDELNAY